MTSVRDKGAIMTAYVLLLFHGSVSGMDCEFSESNSLFSFGRKKSCPPPGDSDKQFCCLNEDGTEVYCCSVEDFVVKNGLGVLLPILVALVIGFFFVCCVCCLCCPCCMLYKSRHRGTVYGNVPQGTVQTTVVTAPQAGVQPSNYPVQPQQYPAYPVYPPPTGHQPPPYNEVVPQGYTRQAPYNPNF